MDANVGSKPVTVGGMHVRNLKVIRRSSQIKLPTTSLIAFDNREVRNQEVRQ
jgi:hypothetical protein